MLNCRQEIITSRSPQLELSRCEDGHHGALSVGALRQSNRDSSRVRHLVSWTIVLERTAAWRALDQRNGQGVIYS